MIGFWGHCNDGFFRRSMLRLFCYAYKVMMLAILLIFMAWFEVQDFILKRYLLCEDGTASALW